VAIPIAERTTPDAKLAPAEKHIFHLFSVVIKIAIT